MREEYNDILNRFYESNRSEFMIVYGARRINKSYIINNFLKDKKYITVVGSHKCPTKIQISNFNEALSKYKGEYINFELWRDVFNEIENIIKQTKDKIVLFLDEISWMYKKNSNFLSQLGSFWNLTGAYNDHFKFIVCGSDINFILNRFISTQGEFHLRHTYIMHMKPFTLKETYEYLNNTFNNDNDINSLDYIKYNKKLTYYIYSVFGGMPYYLNQINPNLSIDENINNLIFNENGVLNREFYWLLSSIISSPDKYIDILNVLANNPNGLSYADIAKKLGKITGSTILNQILYLKECDYVIITYPFFDKPKKIKYRLSFEFIDFYLRWVKSKPALTNWLKVIDTSEYYTWRGLCFERVIYKHIKVIERILKCDILKVYFPFINNNKQYDMILETKHIVYIIEAKFTNEPYSLTKSYVLDQVDKMRDLEEITRKEVLFVLVTCDKMEYSEYNYLVHKNIILDDLFD